nr:hypothetical protein [Humibacter ginsenosidimutans]
MHHVDARMRGERLAELLLAAHGLEDAGRSVDVVEQRRDGDASRQRRLGRALQHHGVAERERGRDHAHGEDERKVPRRDHRHDADRDALDDAGAARVMRHDQLAAGASGQSGCRAQLVDGTADLVLGLAANRSGLTHDQVGELVGAGGEAVCGAEQQVGTNVVRLCRPRRLGAAGCGNGPIEVGERSEPGSAELVSRRLLEHGNGRVGRAERAVDVHGTRRQIGGGRGVGEGVRHWFLLEV